MEHTYEPLQGERVLAVDPISRGFGYVVLEEDGPQLVDWGVKVCERNEIGCTLSLRKLIAQSEPTVLVFEDVSSARSLRRIALEAFIDTVADGIADLKLPVRMYSRREIRKRFSAVRAITKTDIASLLVERFPELRGKRPKQRQLWESEDVRMSIFDALSMALTHLSSGDG